MRTIKTDGMQDGCLLTNQPATTQLHNYRYRVEVHFSATSSSSVVASLVHRYVLSIYTKSLYVFVNHHLSFRLPPRLHHITPPPPHHHDHRNPISTHLLTHQRWWASCLTAMPTHFHRQIFQPALGDKLAATSPPYPSAPICFLHTMPPQYRAVSLTTVTELSRLMLTTNIHANDTLKENFFAMQQRDVFVKGCLALVKKRRTA